MSGKERQGGGNLNIYNNYSGSKQETKWENGWIVLYLVFMSHVTISVCQDKTPGGYSHTLPIRVCTAQRGRDF